MIVYINTLEKILYCKQMKDIPNIIDEMMQVNERASDMETTLENRILIQKYIMNSDCGNQELARVCKSKISAYEDCIAILKNEFKPIHMPRSIDFQTYINMYKNNVVDVIFPIENTRGSSEYMKNLRKAGKVADLLEQICKEMFLFGYNAKNQNHTIHQGQGKDQDQLADSQDQN